MHQTNGSTIAHLKSGKFGVTSVGLERLVKEFSYGCYVCNKDRLVTFTQMLGKLSVKKKIDTKPFTDLSIDPLGHVYVKAHKKARIQVKMYPLIAMCRQMGACQVLMMEESKAVDVTLALLRVENRFGIKIERWRVDAGKNLIEGNLNPCIDGKWSEKHNEGQRLFDAMTMVKHAVNSQFRNYLERATCIIKKWMRQASSVRNSKA